MLESAKCKSAVRCRRHCAGISKRPQRISASPRWLWSAPKGDKGEGKHEGEVWKRRGRGALLTACPLLLTESRSQQQAPTLSPATLFIIAANAAPPPPCSCYCTSSLHSVSGQQFAPMLQVGDIATDTSRSLARCLKLCIVSSSSPPCSPVAASSRRSQWSCKGISLAPSHLPPPPSLSMARSSLCRLWATWKSNSGLSFAL